MNRSFLGLIAVVVALVTVIGCQRQPNPTASSGLSNDNDASGLLVTSIGDRIWNDLNQNGIQDAGEPGMRGLPVALLNCQNMPVKIDTTDTLGNYSFTDIPAGQYKLLFMKPANYSFTANDQGSNDSLDSDPLPGNGFTVCVTFADGETNLTLDAGVFTGPPPKASLGDLVFNDLDSNGVQEAGEPGVSGVVVNLFTCADVPARSDTTDSFGFYFFDQLLLGSYKVQFVLPDSWKYSPQDAAVNDSLDSDVDPLTGFTACTDLVASESDNTLDAGVYLPQPPPIIIPDSGCTHTVCYWKNRTGFGCQPDSVTPLLPITLGSDGGAKSVVVSDSQIAFDILSLTYYGKCNGIAMLYAQLLAAKLNFASGADPSAVTEVVADADAFLADHDYLDWSILGEDERQLVLGWQCQLGKYNQGEIGPGQCAGESDSAEEHEDDDGGGDND
ncbi:MAG: SdrD B-like domain-containing protein [Candidatus Zixiibacteriota bacterium]